MIFRQYYLEHDCIYRSGSKKCRTILCYRVSIVIYSLLFGGAQSLVSTHFILAVNVFCQSEGFSIQNLLGGLDASLSTFLALKHSNGGNQGDARVLPSCNLRQSPQEREIRIAFCERGICLIGDVEVAPTRSLNPIHCHENKCWLKWQTRRSETTKTVAEVF
jgi:hypothetical protein